VLIAIGAAFVLYDRRVSAVGQAASRAVQLQGLYRGEVEGTSSPGPPDELMIGDSGTSSVRRLLDTDGCGWRTTSESGTPKPAGSAYQGEGRCGGHAAIERSARLAPSDSAAAPRQLRAAVGRVVLRHVVDIDHRRLHVRVAHPGLYVCERRRLDGKRAERVTKVVEDDRVLLRA
jgi:hypothetical protein